MTTDLTKKAMELALAIRKLDELTRALMEYSEEIQILSRKISQDGRICEGEIDE